MNLYFSRLRLFEASFYIAEDEPRVADTKERAGTDETRLVREIYRVTTTVRKHSIFPEITTIEYFDHTNPISDKLKEDGPGKVVAVISWNWPSQDSSIINIGGKVMKLNEFLKRGKGITNTNTHLKIGDSEYTWKSAVFRPAQLYDPTSRSIARYIPNSGSFQLSTFVKGSFFAKVPEEKDNARKVSRSFGASRLELEKDIFESAEERDYAVSSFFVYKACRDLSILLTPWWRKDAGEVIGIKV